MAKKTKKVRVSQVTGERGSWGAISPVTRVVPSRKHKPKRESNKLQKELRKYY